jgi:2-oxoglutarate ferredoxin oxidoreductase subunit alpha
VLLLSDSFLANSAEAWRIVSADELPDLRTPGAQDNGDFKPYVRDSVTLARPWVVPGTPGCEHRLGGLEKLDGSGAVSYDAENHQRMVALRAEKIARIANDIPPAKVSGPAKGDVLVVGWGSTYGAIAAAVDEVRQAGHRVAHLHLTHLNPFPANLSSILAGYQRVLVPENNLGHLRLMLRERFLVDAQGFAKVEGRPFRVHEIRQHIETLLGVTVP